MSTGGDFFPNIRASRLTVQLILRLGLPPRSFIPRCLRRRGEPGQLARGRLYAIQALTITAISRLRDLCFQVQDQGSHNRGAGADDCEVDLQNAGQGVSDTNPCIVVGEDFPGIRSADDADDASNDAKAHEEIKGDFGAKFEAGIPEEEDWEGGADEICYY